MASKTYRRIKMHPDSKMRRSLATVRELVRGMQEEQQPVECAHTRTIRVFIPASGASTRDESETVIYRDVCQQVLHGAMA